MSKLEKAIIGAIDEVEVMFKSDGVVLNKIVKKFGRFNRLKVNDKITIYVPQINLEMGTAESKSGDN